MAYTTPIAYFLTWGCYGTRLHGDERGSVSDGHNEFGTAFRPPDLVLESFRADQLSEPPFLITPAQRGCIVRALDDCVDFHDWRLFAANIRTNHVHVVISADGPPGVQMGKLKSRVSRMLREEKLIGTRKHLWAEGGSKKWLFTPAHVDDACEYVLNGQGPDLPTE